MPIIKDPVRITRREFVRSFRCGSFRAAGFNSTIGGLTPGHPFPRYEESPRRLPLHRAPTCATPCRPVGVGPLEADRPWDSYTDRPYWPDGSTSHREIHGGWVTHPSPFIWNLISRARPSAVVAARATQPSRHRPDCPPFLP